MNTTLVTNSSSHHSVLRQTPARIPPRTAFPVFFRAPDGARWLRPRGRRSRGCRGRLHPAAPPAPRSRCSISSCEAATGTYRCLMPRARSNPLQSLRLRLVPPLRVRRVLHLISQLIISSAPPSDAPPTPTGAASVQPAQNHIVLAVDVVVALEERGPRSRLARTHPHDSTKASERPHPDRSLLLLRGAEGRGRLGRARGERCRGGPGSIKRGCDACELGHSGT